MPPSRSRRCQLPEPAIRLKQLLRGSVPYELMAARVEPSPPSSGVGGGVLFCLTLVVIPHRRLQLVAPATPDDPA